MNVNARLFFPSVTITDYISNFVVTRLLFFFLQHTRFVQECKDAEPDVLFVGDSMVQLMQQYEVRYLLLYTGTFDCSHGSFLLFTSKCQCFLTCSKTDIFSGKANIMHPLELQHLINEFIDRKFIDNCFDIWSF